jgi:hypothetical protein
METLVHQGNCMVSLALTVFDLKCAIGLTNAKMSHFVIDLVSSTPRHI